MTIQVKLKESSKIDWQTPVDEKNKYPGDKNIELGCLMRIADATEKMASNYIQLQNDLDWYKKRYETEQKTSVNLNRKIASLKGVITKLKNKYA